MQNYANGPEIPMGFGMALAENMPAMEYFASLSHEQQQAVIAHTHPVSYTHLTLPTKLEV